MWDVIVVGGGPAGSRCAAALASESWRVLLADASRSDNGALADTLGPAAGRRVQRCLPADVTLESLGVRCRGLLAMWDSAAPSVTDYELEQCAPGYTVLRPALDHHLFHQASVNGAAVRRSWTCVRIDADDVHRPVRAEFSTPGGRRTEESRLIIVATGRARIPGTPKRTYVDRQLAFAAIVDGTETHDLLWVERSEEGWWYLTRLSASGTQIVFVTQPGPRRSRGEARAHLFTEAFARTRLIRSAFSVPPRIEHVSIHDARASVPTHPCADRVLLIGDAAGTVDPLSGRGWMQALQSAEAMAEHASDCLRGSRPLDAVAHYQDNTTRFAQHLAGRQSILTHAAPALA